MELTARAANNVFELFLIRAPEVILLSAAETDARREVKLTCKTTPAGIKWYHGRLPITAEEMRMLVKQSFRQLVEKTVADIYEKRGLRRGSFESPLTAEEMEKQLLAQKIITQQEQLQRQIARDIHDAVIGDITMLKRSLASEGAAGMVGSEVTIPFLDGSVELHIFRILQESLNNITKHARATEVSLLIAREKNDLVFTLKDNGKGIDFTTAMKLARQGGMGMGSMQERVGLIRCHHPASLTVRSNPGKGTVIKLAIELNSTLWTQSASQA